jgi:hypothetical protein
VYDPGAEVLTEARATGRALVSAAAAQRAKRAGAPRALQPPRHTPAPHGVRNPFSAHALALACT